MASNHRKRKLQTYQSLSSINQHFAAISHHCWRLEHAGFLPITKIKVFRGLIRELQSMISHDVADKMHAVEDEDMFRYGQMRIAWEHYMNPDRPAFRQSR